MSEEVIRKIALEYHWRFGLSYDKFEATLTLISKPKLPSAAEIKKLLQKEISTPQKRNVLRPLQEIRKFS